MSDRLNHNLLGLTAPRLPVGTFDVDVEAYYQSDADFEKSIELWHRFPEQEVVMPPHDLDRAHKLLPDVPVGDLAAMKTKCNRPCQCGRENNALDLIEFCLDESFHGTMFLTRILTERRKDKKISIMDSTHRSPLLPDSVNYIDDTKPIACASCGEDVHLYLLHRSLAHYWLC